MCTYQDILLKKISFSFSIRLNGITTTNMNHYLCIPFTLLYVGTQYEYSTLYFILFIPSDNLDVINYHSIIFGHNL